MDMKAEVYCQHCGKPLDASYRGPCPDCNKEGRLFKKTLSATVQIKAQLAMERRREFKENNPKAWVLLIIVTFTSPIIGYFVGGLIGSIIGLLLGLLSLLIGPHTVKKIKEIEKFNA